MENYSEGSIYENLAMSALGRTISATGAYFVYEGLKNGDFEVASSAGLTAILSSTACADSLGELASKFLE